MKKIIYIIFALLYIGCSTTAPQRTQLMKELSLEAVTAFDIRVRLNNFAILLMPSIENSLIR